jgi:hypothetical protein
MRIGDWRNNYQDLSPAAKRALLRALYDSKGARYRELEMLIWLAEALIMSRMLK